MLPGFGDKKVVPIKGLIGASVTKRWCKRTTDSGLVARGLGQKALSICYNRRMAKKPNLTQIPALRAKQGRTQQDFWSTYAVTQSAASRYESAAGNRSMPHPVAMLVWLHQSGYLSDRDLEKAKAATAGFERTRLNARGARR